MILKLLTGGIDLPKLDAKVSNLELALAEKYEETNAALADHTAKSHELIASRALAEDVETLRLKLNRLDGDIGNCTFGPQPTEESGFTRFGLSGVVSAMADTVRNQESEINALKAQVAALTAMKLGEVKARKAPAKKVEK